MVIGVGLFSGGLDSILAVKVLQDQKIKIIGVTFCTPFFGAERAQEAARHLEMDYRIVDITVEHLEMVRQPKHGYGRHMNPCIDCHAMMFRKAGELMEDEKADFLFSGEVLGERPMSQNRKALSIVDNESGLEGFIIRPLSAKCLPISTPEERGWVKRDSLMDFSGRSRRPQMELAKRLNIQRYPSPAGGCLLTDKAYAKRLKDLLSCTQIIELRELKLLRLGRHFRIDENTKVVVGRNRAENQAILKLSTEDDLLLSPVSVPGPTVLVVGEILPGTDELAAVMTVSYSDAKENEMIEISVRVNGRDKVLTAKDRNKVDLRRYMIQ